MDGIRSCRGQESKEKKNSVEVKTEDTIYSYKTLVRLVVMSEFADSASRVRFIIFSQFSALVCYDLVL